ncbi:hypothetical protein [Streptomyces sp. GC420]|uniref:hypothetical protein n=1 Tax=Streptomyces sp. GC420 TaxID=2697568 RepID=UPI0028BF0D1F|nr:hypothetical protein [Streptomyces sp. GC420]
MAVLVRAGSGPLWWSGVLAAGIGAVPPGITGRRIGVLAGAVLLLLAFAAVALVRGRRYTHFARTATRAARSAYLQDRGVTIRNWRRSHRWWLLLAFLAAVGSSFAVPAAGGLLLAGCGAGLWAKAVRLGRLERSRECLLWVRTDWIAKGAVGKPVRGFQSTGIAAGDAAPGGARRRSTVAV